MKALIAVMCGLVLSSVAQARDVKPVRVIPITRESAAASALALASANSPLIGMPPVGRAVARPVREQLAARGSTADAHAEFIAPDTPASAEDVCHTRVEVLKPSASGGFTVDAYLVPNQRNR